MILLNENEFSDKKNIQKLENCMYAAPKVNDR